MTQFRSLVCGAGVAWLGASAFAQSGIPVETVTGPTAAPVCIVTLRVEQLSWTLNPVEHLKDRLNALKMDLPADPAFCAELRPGQTLASQFRWGSYLLRGGTADLVVTVERIQNHGSGPGR